MALNNQTNINLEVSEKAVLRVKDRVEIPTVCHYCNDSVVLSNNSAIYRKSLGKWPYVYLCTGCGAHVGLHPNTDLPLGTLADGRTRAARKRAKHFFINYQKQNNISRGDAYKFLSGKMGIDPSKCHFAMFSVNQCQHVISIFVEAGTAE